MKRTKNKMKRTNLPKIYIVQYNGLKDRYFINSRQYKFVPYLMTIDRATRLVRRLNERYVGTNFKKEKYEQIRRVL